MSKKKSYGETGRIGLKATAVWVSFAVVFLLPCAAAFGGREDFGLEEKPGAEEEIPDYILHDVIHHHYEDGLIKVVVTFDRGRYYSGGTELLVEKSRFVYYDRKGEVVSRGSSNHAKLFDDGARLIAEENVIVISEENGGRLDTEYLEWHEDTNQFTTDRFVTLTQKNGDTISGTGMVADTGL